jgi:hypothetical protein
MPRHPIGVYQTGMKSIFQIYQISYISDIRYKEHIYAIRNNNSNSGNCNHVLSTCHTYSRITDTVDAIRTRRKGKYLSTLEKYNIYKIKSDNLQMNDTHNDIHNPIFLTLQKLHIR